MIVDTAALVAILYREPEAADFAQCIHDAAVCRFSAATRVELSIVIESQLGPRGRGRRMPSSGVRASSSSR